MTQSTPHRYTAADVNRIIKRALNIEKDESISHTELLETAKELGIDSEKIEQAIAQEVAVMEQEKKRQAYLKRARSYFLAGLGGYLNFTNTITLRYEKETNHHRSETFCDFGEIHARGCRPLSH